MQYKDAPKEVADLVNKVRSKYFPELEQANIKIIFDTTKRAKKWLAQIRKPNKLVRYLTTDEDGILPNGWDYIIVIDETPWDYYNEGDQMRIIRHELRHCNYNPEQEERDKQYNLEKHDVEDFYAEIRLATEENELEWKKRASEVAFSIYEEIKEEKKNKKKSKKKKE